MDKNMLFILADDFQFCLFCFLSVYVLVTKPVTEGKDIDSHKL